MTKQTHAEQITHRWYMRPVFFVGDVGRQEGIAELRREIAERSIPNKESWWGYDVIQIDDPDGNELLFPRLDMQP